MTSAVLTRAVPVIVRGCGVCFGTGQIFAKPGVLVPCPNGCGSGFAMAGGCLDCGCSPSSCGSVAGCGCTCCCSYLPATAPRTGGVR